MSTAVNESTDVKQCSNCKETKPYTEFNKRTASKDGLQSKCRGCTSGYNKRRYIEQYDNIRTAQNTYRRTNKEHISQIKKKSYERTKTHVLEYQRNYYVANTEAVAQRNKKWYSENWYKSRGYSSAYRARRKSSFIDHVGIQELIDRDGTACSYCTKELEFGTNKVHMDHIWPLAKDGLHCKDNLVLACQTCNTSKGDKMPGDFVRVKGYEHLISPHVKEIIDLITEVRELTAVL